MQLRKFFSVLVIITGSVIAGYYISEKLLFDKEIPDAPCSMAIVNGNFINDQYQKYQFNGAITFWLKSNVITVFGVYNTAAGMKKITRSLLLENVKRESEVVTANVQSVNISSSDQLPATENFFGSKGERLTIHFKNIKRGEYLVMVNNNWVSICKEN